MGSLTFTLNGHPPLPNRTKGWHWTKRSKAMRVWRDAAAWACKAAYRDSDLEGDFRPVAIHAVFTYRVRRVRDVDNLGSSLKPIIDGCVDARMLMDDGPEYLRAVTVAERVDPDGIDGVTVTITEVEP